MELKRRDFLAGVGAAAAMPAIPAAALAPVASAAPAAAVGHQAYLWAEFISRVHNKSSPAMLTRLLKMEEATAQAVYDKLLANNVVTAPDAYGLSRAVDPYKQYSLSSHTSVGKAAAQKPRPKLARSTRRDSHPVNHEVPELRHDPCTCCPQTAPDHCTLF